jgi:hypothetical protein
MRSGNNCGCTIQNGVELRDRFDWIIASVVVAEELFTIRGA